MAYCRGCGINRGQPKESDNRVWRALSFLFSLCVDVHQVGHEGSSVGCTSVPNELNISNSITFEKKQTKTLVLFLLHVKL